MAVPRFGDENLADGTVGWGLATGTRSPSLDPQTDTCALSVQFLINLGKAFLHSWDFMAIYMGIEEPSLVHHKGPLFWDRDSTEGPLF